MSASKRSVVVSAVSLVLLHCPVLLAQQQPAIRNIRSPYVKQRIAAAKYFGSSEDSANTKHLLVLLKDRTARVREAAALALGELNAPATHHNDERERDTSCLPLLLATLGDPDAGVRRAAVTAIKSIHDLSTVSPVTEMLKDAEPAVRVAAAEALESFASGGYMIQPVREPASVAALIAALRDDNAAVVTAGVSALGAMQDHAAVPALSQLYQSGNLENSTAVFVALTQICDPASTPIFVDALERALLANEEAWVTQEHARASSAAMAIACVLKKRPDARATETVLRAMRRAYPNRFFLEALAATRDPRAFAEVLKWTDSPVETVRQDASKVLVEMADPSNMNALASLLKHSDPEIRANATRAFARLENFTAPLALLEAVTDASDSVRRGAVQALVRSRDSRAIGVLIPAMQADPSLSLMIVQSKDPRLLPVLINILRDPARSPFHRGIAAQALGELGDVGAVEPLLAMIRAPEADVRLYAIQSLRKLKDVRAVAPLQQILGELEQQPLMKRDVRGVQLVRTALIQLGARPNR